MEYYITIAFSPLVVSPKNVYEGYTRGFSFVTSWINEVLVQYDLEVSFKCNKYHLLISILWFTWLTNMEGREHHFVFFNKNSGKRGKSNCQSAEDNQASTLFSTSSAVIWSRLVICKLTGMSARSVVCSCLKHSVLADREFRHRPSWYYDRSVFSLINWTYYLHVTKYYDIQLYYS